MSTGARDGQGTWLRGLVARAAARALVTFVVPGVEIARAHGLDLAAAGLHVSPTPRHANVLLLVGEIPPGLVQAAAVVYAQMPRPRALLAVGTGPMAPLPTPDVMVALAQRDLAAGVARLRGMVAAGAWSRDVMPYDGVKVRSEEDTQRPDMHRSGMRHGDMGDMGDMDHGAPDASSGASPATHHDQHMISGSMDVMATGYDTSDADDKEMTRSGRVGGNKITGHDESDRDAMTDTAMAGMPPSDGVDDDDHGDGGHDTMAAHGGDGGHDTMAAHGAGGSDGAKPDHDDRQHRVRSDMGRMQHDGMDMSGMDHDEMQQGSMVGTGMDHDMGGMDHDMGGTDMAGMPHGGMAMGGMAMGGMAMSMAMMTKDLPRSRDGLPMEWVEAPFGPLFPGLPGGLTLAFTLDGDTVARAAVTLGTMSRELVTSWMGPAATLPERMARLDPFAPMAYRLLATRALEDAAGITVDEVTARRRIAVLERERAASHLGWLAGFASLLGDRWIAERATALQRALVRADDGDRATIVRLGGRARAFANRVRRTPYLRRRLIGVGRPRPTAEGQPPEASGANRISQDGDVRPRGPLARAAHALADARAADPAYHALGFAPVLANGDDALARLLVRLGELEQSMALGAGTGFGGAGRTIGLDRVDLTVIDGSGKATVETPRGVAALRLVVADGVVREVAIDTPSASHARLIGRVSEGREVADALVGVASLDLSPWEMDQ